MTLPEHIRKLMSKEDREKLNQPTIEDLKPKLEAKLEKDLQKQIYIDLTRREIFFCWNRIDKRSTGIPGTPDFVFPYKGYFIALECKTDTGKTTLEQNAAADKISKQGGLYYTVRSFDQYLAILK